MKENKSPFITNGKEKIKCSNCGSEKKFVLLSEPDLASNNNELNLNGLPTEKQITEKQNYLAHYFEAQQRFGE